MKKYRKWLGWGAVLVIVLLLFWFFYYGSDGLNRKKAPEKYSVILYQHTENSWASLNEGVEQAAIDYGVDVNYVTMAIHAGVREQEALIDREIENGAQGLLVAAVDSEGLKEKLADVDTKGKDGLWQPLLRSIHNGVACRSGTGALWTLWRKEE